MSLSDNDSRFLCLDCAYITSCLNVSCSGPARLDAAAQYLIWSFTELRRACTYTLTHTALCREHGPLFCYRFLLPRMQLCITANILKWPLFWIDTLLSLFPFTHMYSQSHMCIYLQSSVPLSVIMSGSFVTSVGSGHKECAGKKWGTCKGQLNTIIHVQLLFFKQFCVNV